MRELTLSEMRLVAGGQDTMGSPTEKQKKEQDKKKEQEKLDDAIGGTGGFGGVLPDRLPEKNQFRIETTFGGFTVKNEPLPGQENLTGLSQDSNGLGVTFMLKRKPKGNEKKKN